MSLENSLKTLRDMMVTYDRIVPDDQGVIKVIGRNEPYKAQDMVNSALNIDQFVNSHLNLFEEKKAVLSIIEIKKIIDCNCEWNLEVPEAIKQLTKRIIQSTVCKALVHNVSLNSDQKKETIISNLKEIELEVKNSDFEPSLKINIIFFIESIRKSFENDEVIETELNFKNELNIILKILLGGNQRLEAFREITSENAYKTIETLGQFAYVKFDKEIQINLFGKLKESELVKLFEGEFKKRNWLILDLLKNKVINDDLFLKLINEYKENEFLYFFKQKDLSYEFPFESLYEKGLKKEFLFMALSHMPQDQTFQILERIDQSRHLIKEYADYIKLKLQKSPIDAYFPESFKRAGTFEKVARSIETHLPMSLTDRKKIDLWKGVEIDLITETMVFQAFHKQNYAAIDFVIQYAKPDWIKKNAPLFLECLMLLEDEKIANACLKKCPDLRLGCTFELFKKGVTQGFTWFTDWILKESRFDLSQELREECLSIAIKSYNLDLMKCLDKDCVKHLNLDQIKEDKNLLLQEVTKYAIQSSLLSVYALLEVYPEIATVLIEALEKASLVVRFPNLLYPAELNQENSDIEKYLKNTLDYSKENNDFVIKTVSTISKISHNQFIDLIINDRYNRFPLLNREEEYSKKDYKTKLLESETTSTTYTPLNKENGLPCRYTHSLKHLADFAYDFEAQEWKSKLPYSSVKWDNSGILFSYKTESFSLLSYPTTRVCFESWIHTPKRTVHYLKNEREALHRDIFNFPLKADDPKSMRLFLAKVARGYWLMATLCEVIRGTPHNSMIWLNEVYRHHNLPPPIPLKDHFFLDNTMLMIPYERAIELWETFFEPTLDKVIDETLLKKLLSVNGLILGLCSPKTRARKEMVEMAVSQNKEASRFAL
jgi:hypothetical protein